jgi:hypothetical protein
METGISNKIKRLERPQTAALKHSEIPSFGANSGDVLFYLRKTFVWVVQILRAEVYESLLRSESFCSESKISNVYADEST